ncbi:MAG: sulfotransferase [Flavobacterium sp.]
MRLKKRIVFKLKLELNRIKSRKRTKYFCIGRNKTGTTSIAKAFQELGFVVGNQRTAELLMDDYFKGDFDCITKYCKTAEVIKGQPVFPEVFQDVPFSMANTYKIMDKAYPNSKFILTIRNNAEEWYNSLTKFHAKCFGNGGAVPTWDDLKKADYVYEGWMYNQVTKQYNLTESEEPYIKEKLMAHYERHNHDVMDYFKDRPQDLLIINLADKKSYARFCDFVGVDSKNDTFPWENKTDNIVL